MIPGHNKRFIIFRLITGNSIKRNYLLKSIIDH
jgi:hypothetical protein